MAHPDAGPHRDRAERAEQRADAARRRTAEALATAERHDRLTAEGHGRHTDVHVRAAALYREAAALHERAAALHAEHADHERHAAGPRGLLGAASRPTDSDGADGDGGLRARYEAHAHRESLANRRDRVADARDRAADERERAADARDRAADERDGVAGARETDLDERERRLIDAGHLFPGIAEQRRQLARASAAIDRAHGQVARGTDALERAEARADADQADVDREVATSERKATEPD